ncbi:MAG: GNAT family N-acetyltransferase [Candidatus Brocadia sp.]|nr:GNAT family N-acetyltransferase [Candidatus Brocadia sp.]
MNKNFQKLIALYKQLGFRKVLEKLLRFMISKIYLKHDELLFVKNLDEGIKIFNENKLQVQSVTSHHSCVIRQFNEKYRDMNNILALDCYFKNNYKGFLAFFHDEMIGHWWWVDNKIDPVLTHPCIHRLGFSLKEDEVYGFDNFIAPQYRGQGNAIKFLSMLHYELKKMGYNRIWCFVVFNNMPAKRLYSKAGYEVVRRVIGHKVFSLFLFQDKMVFVKNSKWNTRHPFDYRLLFARRVSCKEDKKISVWRTLGLFKKDPGPKLRQKDIQ